MTLNNRIIDRKISQLWTKTGNSKVTSKETLMFINHIDEWLASTGDSVSPKTIQMAHNQVYNRQIGLRPSQHMLVLPSLQSA